MAYVKRDGGAAGETARFMVEVPEPDAERIGREAAALGMSRVKYGGLLLARRPPCSARLLLMETAERLRALENSTEDVAYELGKLYRLGWNAKDMEEKAAFLKEGLEIFKGQEDLIRAYLDLEREVRAAYGALGRPDAAGCPLRDVAVPATGEE